MESLWDIIEMLGGGPLPETLSAPEMAAEVGRLYREGIFAERRILAMGGHEDGIVVFGRSPEEAGSVLMRWLARACEPEI